MWFILRSLTRLFGKLPWWVKLASAACAPLFLLNTAVAFFGHSAVVPLSPFFVQEKVGALKSYARHRPGCLLSGHPDSAVLAREAEVRHGLPHGLMQAVVDVESEGRAHRISPAGAMGPAQLMPGTAAMLGVKDPFDPAESIDAGARYLASLLKRTGDVRLAVASYNAGPGAVNGSIPKNGETPAYVARVMRRFSGSAD